MSKKTDDFKQDIVFRAIEWGFGVPSFKAQDLFDALNPTGEERELIKSYFVAAGDKTYHNTANRTEETIFYTSDKTGVDGINMWDKKLFSLTTESKFKYIDFLELEQARKNSKQAWIFSLISIGLAILALIVSTIEAFKPITPIS